MELVTIVTRDVADRVRGFLASVMLEVAPCTYISPRMNSGVRERTWQVVSDWHHSDPVGSLVMIWSEKNATGGIGLAHLGVPSKELIELDGMWVVRLHGSG